MSGALLLLLLAFVAAIQANTPSNPYAARTCTHDFDCFSVSTNPAYVSCSHGLCACSPLNGFSGNATTVSKCRCDSPRSVQWVSNHGLYPVCLDVVNAVKLQYSNDRCARLKSKIVRLYQLIVWPTPVAVVTGQIPLHDIFADDTRARISPLGSYKDYEGVLEYFYGLPSFPVTTVNRTDIVNITCDGLYVTVYVNLLFQSQAFPIVPALFNLTEWAFFTFNEQELIVNTDGAILNLGAVIDPKDVINPLTGQVIVDPQSGQALTKEFIADQSIQATCGILTLNVTRPFGTCPGTYPGASQFEQFGACVQFMHTVPLGTWNRANSNTFTCRQLHAILTFYRPEVHCPHAGPTGGGKCVDFAYETYYTDGLFVGQPQH